MTEDAQFLTKTHQIKIFNCEQVIIEADRDKLGQVMTNLLSNAIKYSPKGGQIVIGCQKQDGRLKISVSDQGIGIAGQDHKKLFERFYRVSNDSSRSASGFGIGLYLSAEYLRLHDSQFHLLSELGKGSTFYFYLDEKSVLSQ
ncbi:sensor histidine kinase [Pedobacter sp. UC225_65]|uniref:sensor histidine kinase n=1 Tax=Pedobacter sp. UC225_65 TaxID=3350173 RepID=UPI00366FF7C0